MNIKGLIILFFLLASPVSVFGQVTVKDPGTKEGSFIQIDKNFFNDLRKEAFGLKPIDLDLNLPLIQTTVFGVIIDWHLTKNLATIVAVSTGDASVYLKSGQVFIGGFNHEPLKKLALELVSKAQSYLPEATRTENIAIPDQNTVQFSFLTNKGIYVHQEAEERIKNNLTDWSILFANGYQIISEYRNISESK